MAYIVTNDNGTIHIGAIINTAEEKDEVVEKINQAFADREKLIEPSMKKAVQQQIAAQNKAAAKNESASETIKLTVANYGRLIGLSDQASQVLHQALRTIHELTKKEQRQVVDTLANLVS